MTFRIQEVQFSKLLRLEWQKNRREASLWLALVLYLVPAFMVVAADLVESTNRSPEDAYFVFHNQTMLVLPMAAGTVATAVMRLEVANGTWFSWLTSGVGRFRLWLSKLVFVGIMQTAMCILALTIFLVFFLTRTEAMSDPTVIFQILAAYCILNAFIAVTMTLLITTVIILWRNTVSAMAVSIIVTVLSLIILPAEFSWALSITFAYRLGLLVLSEEYFYQGAHAQLSGAATTTVSLLLLAAIQYGVLQHNRPRRLLG